jgi:hypothetical protein
MYQPQSNYSLSLGFAQELDFWTPDIMQEDIHTANRARLNNFGSRTTVAIPSFICNDTVVKFSDRYTQALRHQNGSCLEFAWVLALCCQSKFHWSDCFAVFTVEATREGSFLEVAKSLAAYGTQFTIFYIIVNHWSLVHWKARALLTMGACYIAWRWLWFWIAEITLWQTLMRQFPIKRPSQGRWLLTILFMPVVLFIGDLIFYQFATLQSLFRITFLSELTYVTAPKGDDLTTRAAPSQAAPKEEAVGPGSTSMPMIGNSKGSKGKLSGTASADLAGSSANAEAVTTQAKVTN